MEITGQMALKPEKQPTMYAEVTFCNTQVTLELLPSYHKSSSGVSLSNGSARAAFCASL